MPRTSRIKKDRSGDAAVTSSMKEPSGLAAQPVKTPPASARQDAWADYDAVPYAGITAVAANGGASPSQSEGTLAVGSVLQGYIDEATTRRITGWVWHAGRPNERVELHILDDQRLVAEVVANQYRPDLCEAGIGDGRHAFTVALDGSLAPDERHVLHLRCALTGADVPGSPVTI